MMTVRAFYLDIAQWALDEPHRWAQWAVPCPVKETDCNRAKHDKLVKSRMDQRTRERLPHLPALARAVSEHRLASAALLEQARHARPGDIFTSGGQSFRRLPAPTAYTGSIWACPSGGGPRADLTRQESEAFWAWAFTEVLRHTGIRFEELRELSHHSITQYRLPSTGELVPLLQIAPSKAGAERLLLVSPELADVLSGIVSRIRGRAGAIPLVPGYDTHEKTWNPPLPLLFQRAIFGEHRPISDGALREILQRALAGAGIRGHDGQPLVFTPHDFRRIFVTDAVLNGLPPHIAQVICGHRDISTTMGYKAIYPAEAIEAHRAFITRRRQARPSEEYRTPTEEEWDQFLAHFEKRKLSAGICARLRHAVHPRARLHQVLAPAARPRPARPARGDPRQSARPHQRSRTRGLARRSRRTEGQPRRRRRQAHPDRHGPTASSHHGPARHARIPRHPSRQPHPGSLTGKPDNRVQTPQFREPRDTPRSTWPGCGARCSPRAWPPGCTSSPPAPPARTSCTGTASAAAKP